MPRQTLPKLEFHALTPDRWPDLEALFGARGACGGCWCMHWRLPAAEYQAGKGEKNRTRLKQLVQRGDASGIIAYADSGPIGWCAVEPREAFVRLQNSRVLRAGDGVPVWSIPCLFVNKDYRKRGVSVKLLQAAVAHAKSRGAKIVEGYPVIPKTADMPAAFAWTGTLAAFKSAGFTEFVRHSPSRPIMRCATGGGRAPRIGNTNRNKRRPAGRDA